MTLLFGIAQLFSSDSVHLFVAKAKPGETAKLKCLNTGYKSEYQIINDVTYDQLREAFFPDPVLPFQEKRTFQTA